MLESTKYRNISLKRSFRSERFNAFSFVPPRRRSASTVPSLVLTATPLIFSIFDRWPRDPSPTVRASVEPFS